MLFHRATSDATAQDSPSDDILTVVASARALLVCVSCADEKEDVSP